MNQYLLLALLGLTAGSVFAMLSQSAVVAYRGSGVVNLATGAIAMYVAYTYAGLRAGQLMILPLPNPLALIEGIASWFGDTLRLPRWPTFVGVGGPMGVVPALVICAAVSAVLGGLSYWLVFRPLRNASPLAKTIASVGLLLALQAVVILRFGTDSIVVPNTLPSGSIKVGSDAIPVNGFVLLAIAVVVCVALALVFGRTRFGIATKAAAGNERGAIMLGLSPSRLAASCWVISSLVAGMAGALFASISGLNPTDYTLFVIPALAAALLARMNSFVVATVAAVLIGCAQSVTVALQSSFSWWPQFGSANGIPLIIIAIAMIVIGRTIPERGAIIRIRLPESPAPKYVFRTGLPLLLLTLAGLIWLPYDLRGAIDNSLIGVVVALSFVVVAGFAGQISLMQLSLAGVAALAMTTFAGSHGWPFLAASLASILVAGLVGVIAGLPALRVRGVELAVLTLGAAYVFESMVLDNPSILTGADQSNSIPQPSLFGLNFGINDKFPFGNPGSPNAGFGMFLIIVVVICIAGVIWLRRSALGRHFLAVRSDERAAAGLGISVASTKLFAFGIGAIIAGVSGVLNAYAYQSITAGPYVSIASVSALAIAYLGGISTVSGAIWAGTLATGGFSFRILERVAHLGQYEQLISGVGLVLAAILNPEGIAGVFRVTCKQVAARLNAILASRRPAALAGATSSSAAVDGETVPPPGGSPAIPSAVGRTDTTK
jgi:ABC-type branched-subunit amino acid transport system permease subunit